jgi:hypothetical protein
VTTPAGNNGSVVQSIVDLKRRLTDLKLDALLLEPGRSQPITSIHDLDAIAAEVVAGVEERRYARPSVSGAQADYGRTSRAPDNLRMPSTRP